MKFKKPNSIPNLFLIVGVIFLIFGSMLMTTSKHLRRVPQADGTIKNVIEETDGNKACALMSVTGLAMILGSGSYMVYRKVKKKDPECSSL